MGQRKNMWWTNHLSQRDASRPLHPARELKRACRWTVPVLAFAAFFITPDAADAQLRVSPVDWVQGRSEIPHPAMNGRTTILQAIAEGGNCGGNYQYRWDWNGDGDYDDNNEGWRGAGAGGHRGGYWAALGLEVQFPNQPGDRLYYPKVEVDCGGQRQATTFPVLVRVDRLCPNYPADINGGCQGEQNIALTRALVHDREVDRSLWWMFQL